MHAIARLQCPPQNIGMQPAERRLGMRGRHRMRGGYCGLQRHKYTASKYRYFQQSYFLATYWQQTWRCPDRYPSFADECTREKAKGQDIAHELFDARAASLATGLTRNTIGRRSE